MVFCITTLSIMKLSIMTLGIMTLSITEHCYAECHLYWVSHTSPLCWVSHKSPNAECHIQGIYAECHIKALYAECHIQALYAECCVVPFQHCLKHLVRLALIAWHFLLICHFVVAINYTCVWLIISATIGLYHLLDGDTNQKYKLLHFLTIIFLQREDTSVLLG